jgi:hypothetical protein
MGVLADGASSIQMEDLMSLTEPVQGAPYTGPDYQGFAFTLKSTGPKYHLLTISKQTAEQILNQAYITGLWQGESAPGVLMGTPKQIAGVITGNGNSIKCSWSPPPSGGSGGGGGGSNSGGTNVLIGSLTYKPGYFVEGKGIDNLPIGAFVPPSASLQGTVTAYDMNGNIVPGGPGNVSGSAYGPF